MILAECAENQCAGAPSVQVVMFVSAIRSTRGAQAFFEVRRQQEDVCLCHVRQL
jgi:hypothetical protein